MIYPIPPETEFFCWFMYNGCCNSSITMWECGIPPFIYFIAGLPVLVLLYYALKRGLGERKRDSQEGRKTSPLGSEQSQKKEVE